MLVLASAYQLRRQAGQAIREARYRAAYEFASKAQDLHHTALGHKMMLVARVLDTVSVRR